jgi:hypothetical protein
MHGACQLWVAFESVCGHACPCGHDPQLILRPACLRSCLAVLQAACGLSVIMGRQCSFRFAICSSPSYLARGQGRAWPGRAFPCCGTHVCWRPPVQAACTTRRRRRRPASATSTTSCWPSWSCSRCTSGARPCCLPVLAPCHGLLPKVHQRCMASLLARIWPPSWASAQGPLAVSARFHSPAAPMLASCHIGCC